MRTSPLAAALALVLTACASSGPPAGARVVDLDRMEEVAGSESESFVVRIPEGTRLPVSVHVTTPFVHCDEGDPAFHAVFDRTVYWYPRTPDRISFDGTTWEPLSAGGRGRLSFGLGRSEQGGSAARVTLEVVPGE